MNRVGGRVLSAQQTFCAGLDLGQKNDYTALALIEQQERTLEGRCPLTYEHWKESTWRVVHVARMPLRTPYPDVVTSVRNFLMKAPWHAAPRLVVDATGVGQPVVDLIKRRGMPGAVVPVTITGGVRPTPDGRDGWRVPKRELIVGLQVAFETGQLQIDPGIAGVDTLISELMAMRVRPGSSAGHEKFECWRDGAHDDLVLAVALAWWDMTREAEPMIGFGTRRLL